MNKEETFGDLIKLVSKETQENIELLFNKFKTLETILSNDEASLWYHKFMLEVIVEKEKKDGCVDYNFMKYKLKKDWSEIVKKYGGTLLMPCINKKENEE